MTGIPEVLFVCTHNAGRSQMAAALLGHEAAGRVRVTSAGSQPASELNPAVVAAMAELGLDISRAEPRRLTTDNVRAADVVAEDHLTHADRAAAGSYAGCIAGALSRAEYLDGLAAAGFADASVTFTHEAAPGMHSAIIRAIRPAA